MRRAGTVFFVALILLGSSPPEVSGPPATQAPKGPYFGQAPPGTTPAVFAPGFVSTDAHEFACTFSPDGKEFLFTRGLGPENSKAVMVTRQIDGTWTEPEVALPEFTRQNFEPHINVDGSKLYFMGEVSSGGRFHLDMFFASRANGAWQDVVHLGEPFNPGHSMFISTTADGTIYTTHAGVMDIVRSRQIEGTYQAYETLGAPINTESVEFYPFIAPDESYLIYGGMTDAGPGLLVSFRNADGSWTTPKPIPVGMPGGCPSVSPDGRYLFFVAGRPKGDIYWVDMQIVEDLK